MAALSPLNKKICWIHAQRGLGAAQLINSEDPMADETNQNETPAANGQAAPQAPGVQMRLLGQYLKDLSFESPNAPEVLTKLREKPEIKIDMNTRNRKVDQVLRLNSR